MEHAFKLGDRVLATTTAVELPARLNEAKAVVTRILGDDERDEEVGPMYEVTVTVQVFEDELRSLKEATPDDRWADDSIQFPRLLAELIGVGLSEAQWDELLLTMDLTSDQLNELFDRAQVTWERQKATI